MPNLFHQPEPTYTGILNLKDPKQLGEAVSRLSGDDRNTYHVLEVLLMQKNHHELTHELKLDAYRYTKELVTADELEQRWGITSTDIRIARKHLQL